MKISKETWSRTLRTFVQSFVGLLIPGLLAWLVSLQEWATAGFVDPFPGAGALLSAGVAAAFGACVAAVSFFQNAFEDLTGSEGDTLMRRTAVPVAPNEVPMEGSL